MSDLYKEAADLLQKLERRQGGLKSLAYADSVQHKRSSFALVCETLRYKPLLEQLLAAVPQFKLQKRLLGAQRALLLVSLYDLLFGRHKKIQGAGHLKKELMLHANAFKTALVRLKVKAKVATNEGLLPKENRRLELSLPRYVRVNSLTIAPEELEAFVREFEPETDPHVRDLLRLPPGTELHEHPLVGAGKLVLQDKASCFPAFILHGEHSDAPGRGGDVIDACAAPGNKTSHVAMLLRQRPELYADRRVFAFDRSAKRLELLERRMKLAGADDVVVACLQSFLDVEVGDPKYANVRSILLDPSCSGSGMTNRLDHLLDIASSQDKHDLAENEYEEDVASRLQSLADFQLEALLKAFSFPQVERVTYSTCSVFQKENEDVVVGALHSAQNRADARPFVLRPCLETWPRRGLEVPGLSTQEARALVRADGHEDATNGFFVAYFERVGASSSPIAARVAVSTAPLTNGTADGPPDAHGDADGGREKKRKAPSDAQKEARKRRKKDKLRRKREQQQRTGDDDALSSTQCDTTM